jgi:toxin ParE1/3/4
MTRELVVSRRAIDDLINQFAYLDERSESAARRFWTSAFATFNKLAERPRGELLHARNALLQNVRMWRVDGFDNYLICYETTDASVEILRVLHATRDWLTILEMQNR